MHALQIYAGPQALQHLQREGLQPAHVGVLPAAAGGPKGLILGPLDRFLFGQWLPGSTQAIDLVGASIGAWRMATACMPHAPQPFVRLERDYIHQTYDVPPGQRRPTAQHVSERFGQSLDAFYAGQVAQLLQHPRYRLHLIAARGQRVLRRDGRWRTPLGYAGAFISNAVQRRALGWWLERVVFSAQGSALPFAANDYPTQQVALTEANFMPALQASCAIPFALQPVQHIPGAPAGAYWDGGITDYHLHLNYRAERGLVLYPHFQRQVIPGWLDKSLKWRHRASPMLANTVLLAPNPAWVARLPNQKLPDRSDFVRYGNRSAERIAVWQQAASAAQQLADEFAQWLQRPDMHRVQAL